MSNYGKMWVFFSVILQQREQQIAATDIINLNTLAK
jgi:hypothetical protein